MYVVGVSDNVLQLLFLFHPISASVCLLLRVSDEILRHSCGEVIHSINEQTPDVLQKHSSLVLPLVFFAMHQLAGKDHGFLYSIAGCVTGQSHHSESCDTRGAIIAVKSMYIFSLVVPPQNI